MATGSANKFPYVTFVEQGSKPATPAAGNRALYFKTDNKLYHEDEAGTETEVGAGSIGGSTGSTDNVVLLANGTGGATVQASPGGVTINDAGSINIPSGQTYNINNVAHTHAVSGVGLVSTLMFTIDGGGSAITTGIKGDLLVDFACTINAWTLLADQSGAIVVDIWRDTLGNFPPTDGDALPGSGKEPTIAASGTNATDTSITDWTSDDLVAGDILRFNVDSCTTITRCLVALKVTRT